MPGTVTKPKTSQVLPKTVQQKVTPITPTQPKQSEPAKIVQQKQITAPTVSTPEPQVTQTKPIIREPEQKSIYNPNSRAMIDYKTKLRAKLFSKFAVGSIQGSGTCSIQFSVDKNGKLINRKFIKESDNKSLNDTVYYMLMSVPYFTSPPTEYNGSPINMTFTINNGNYEISIN